MKAKQKSKTFLNKKSKVEYQELFECECPYLSRKLPFREEIAKEIIKNNPPRTSYGSDEELVYVANQSGGLLFDYIVIRKLLVTGHKKITIISIEKLLEKDKKIEHAQEFFKNWCKKLSKDGQKVAFLAYKSLEEYEKACIKNFSKRGNLIVTIDPDTKNSVPNFDCKKFLKTLIKLHSNILKPKAQFYYLFFQKYLLKNYRHTVTGIYQPISENKNNFATLVCHKYGENKPTENKYNRIFYKGKEILPFEPIKNAFQIGNQIFFPKNVPKLSKFIEEILFFLSDDKKKIKFPLKAITEIFNLIKHQTKT